jgi:selenide, water dikinase
MRIEQRRAQCYEAAMTFPLTQYAKCAGCAAKYPPGFLFALLRDLPSSADPNVLVGSMTADDAAVYRISEDLALVLTTDFFTPIVDDPSAFGAIAAANALSDVYAMGGTPLAALNLVGFPERTLPGDVLGEVLRGGAAKAREAGIEIVGGHTIKTEEPIYGLAVTGTVHPHRIVRNSGALPGDLLVLTKPLGVGIITTAAKQRKVDQTALEHAVQLMSALNRGAAEAMIEVGAHAATDVTGFGLLGHLRNVARASDSGIEIWLETVPVLEAAWDYARAGIVPGGTRANREFLEDQVHYDPAIDEVSRLVLCDAQTSGGLVIAVEPARAPALVSALERAGTACARVIGRVEPASGERRLRVVPRAS